MKSLAPKGPRLLQSIASARVAGACRNLCTSRRGAGSSVGALHSKQHHLDQYHHRHYLPRDGRLNSSSLKHARQFSVSGRSAGAPLQSFHHLTKQGLDELDHVERTALEHQIYEYSNHELDLITLDDLLALGKPPISKEVLLKNAAYVLHQITVRLAHRLQALRNLPYLIVLNPSISQIYSIYFNSFRVITGTKPPTTLEENDYIVEILEQLVAAHTDTVPILSRGFYEARQYITADEATKVLDNHLRARIGTRMLAENHIALTRPIDPDHYIGAVEVDCKPSAILKETASFVGDICDLKYGLVPHIQFDNQQGVDVTVPYVPVHLEYIFTELLKNAFRATVEYTQQQGSPADHKFHDNPLHDQLPPVIVTIARTSSGAIIRIRDRGGGIPPVIEKNIWDYSFSTFEEAEGDGFSTLNGAPGNSIAGLGYGLPLSRAYAEFFGGKLQVQSYFGWGTDVYLTLSAPRYQPPKK